MTRHVSIAFCIALLLPAAASAQPPKPPEEILQYAFEDDLVHGDLPGTTLEVLRARKRGARESLIRVREHYIDRLLQSVERL